MQVRTKQNIPPRKLRRGEPTRKEVTQSHTFPAPIRGWVLNESLSAPQPAGARILDNWVCGLTTVSPRKGHTKHGTTGDSCLSLLRYKNGGVERLFAATDTDIYNLTAPGDPNVAPAADITGLNSGLWSQQMFGATSGNYLTIANGADDVRQFDGSAWSTPAITGVSSSSLSHVWSYGSQLWFVESGTNSAWYLPTDSIAGAATEFPLDGVFKKGGSLLFGASWSVDAGDDLNDRCVFVSTEGEVAVYSGLPSTAFTLDGLYDMARPISSDTMKAGGDLLIMTVVGLVPLSEALRRDAGALALGAVSYPIEPYWRSQAAKLGQDWSIQKWTSEGLMVISQPGDTAGGGSALVANLQTGAFSRFTGLDTQSLGFFNDAVYFGSSSGSVYRMQNGGSDDGLPYVAAYVGQFETLGLPGIEKSIKNVRPTLSASVEIDPFVSVLVDYDETLSAAPNAATSSASDGWDISTWDVSVWDAEAAAGYSPEDGLWRSVGKTGYAIAPEVQMTFGGLAAPTVDLVDIHATFTVGTLVT